MEQKEKFDVQVVVTCMNDADGVISFAVVQTPKNPKGVVIPIEKVGEYVQKVVIS